MLSMKQVLSEIEASVSNLNLFLLENRFADMPYELGRIAAYSILIQEMLTSKLCESAESSKQ